MAAAWTNDDGKYSKGDTVLMEESDVCAHVIGSSKDKNNWKKFWINNSGRNWPSKCQIYNCGNAATVGAHVYIKYKKGNKFYFILPTCQNCNKDTETDYGSGDCWSSMKQNAVVVATPAKDCAFQ